MAEWLLVSLLFVCPLVLAAETAVYWERVREFFRLLLSGALMMPLRFRRSTTGESSLRLLRSWSSVRTPSDSPLDMVQNAWVGVRVERGGARKGEQRPFHSPFWFPPESRSSARWTDQPADNRRAPKPCAHSIALASSTSFHEPSGNFTQGEKRRQRPHRNISPFSYLLGFICARLWTPSETSKPSSPCGFSFTVTGSQQN